MNITAKKKKSLMVTLSLAVVLSVPGQAFAWSPLGGFGTKISNFYRDNIQGYVQVTKKTIIGGILGGVAAAGWFGFSDAHDHKGDILISAAFGGFLGYAKHILDELQANQKKENKKLDNMYIRSKKLQSKVEENFIEMNEKLDTACNLKEEENEIDHAIAQLRNVGNDRRSSLDGFRKTGPKYRMND